MDRISIGKSGEEEAKSYLLKLGYKILDSNFRSKTGEIDIIAKDHDQIVFVEVKTRSSSLFGAPSEAITPKKLKSIISTGYFYLASKKLKDNFRIDAVEVSLKGTQQEINHIRNISS